MRSMSECLFLFVCGIPPTANLPNDISTPWVASWWKTQRTAPWKPANKLCQSSQILSDLKKKLNIHIKISVSRGILKDRNQIINLHCKACQLPLSLVLMLNVLTLATCFKVSSLSRRRQEKQLCPIFGNLTAEPISTANVNITYSTFKSLFAQNLQSQE